MAIITFLDTSVLLAAYRGKSPQHQSLRELLRDPNRHFVGTPFLWLETMPKASYYQNTAEKEFYQTYFDNVRIWIADTEPVLRVAQAESPKCGLSAIDALHVASAYLAKAEVLLTLEKEEKPLYRTSLVRVIRV